jgi:glucose/mannose transport system substrate-binding protein
MQMTFFSRWVAMALVSTTSMAVAGEVEVLHWWTSGGEAKSIAVLKQMLEQQDHHWIDFAIEGGGGESAMTVLATRAISGNPPSAAQIKGHDIQEWANLDLLADLNDVAIQGDWQHILPPLINQIVSAGDVAVAVPFNIHRTNWLWVNSAVFEQYGLSVPRTLHDFFIVAEVLKTKGIIPLAHGGQPWQDATLFDAVALSVLGPDLYRQAFVDLDIDTLGGDAMIEVFKQFHRLRKYVDIQSPGREWFEATAMVIDGRAAMQVMGDWAKGEFSAKGKIAGQDYQCVAAFGTDHEFSYNVDTLVFFQLDDMEEVKAQKALAQTILTPEFQRLFNYNKGSIPVRQDIDISDFDSCAIDSRAAFFSAAEHNGLVPSMAHGMSTTTYAQSAIFYVVSQFFNDPRANAKVAVRRLVQAVKAAI